MKNSDRITALDSVRGKPPYRMPTEASGFGTQKQPRDPIATLILWLSWLTIGGLVAWGIWGHFTDPDPYASRVIAECREGGGIPKVEKAQNGAVLGVRCEAMLP